MLKEEQKEFLSNLPTGRAIYFTTGTDKAIQIKIKQETDTSEQTPSNDEIMESVTDYYRKNYKKGLYSGLEVFSKEPDVSQFKCIRKLNNELVGKWLSRNGVSESSDKEIKGIIKMIGRNEFVEYLRKHSNRNFQQFISIKYR